MQVLNHGSMCPTIGAANARYTRGSIDEGPGVIISRIGGASSPILLFSVPSLISLTSNLHRRTACRGVVRLPRTRYSENFNFPASPPKPQPPFCPFQYTRLSSRSVNALRGRIGGNQC